MTAELWVKLAHAWLLYDPDPASRKTIECALGSNDAQTLKASFESPLKFGTAGLRGKFGVGPSFINRAILHRAAFATCTLAIETIANATKRGICIGYDGRHFSKTFAEDTASIAKYLGMHVYLFDNTVPTPVLAYTCKRNNCAVGVMVTASHNPPDYNGYKVYWDNAAQLLNPHDVEIERRMCVDPDTVQPLPHGFSSCIQAITSGSFDASDVTLLSAKDEQDYMDAVLARPVAMGWNAQPPLKVAYTAMHGVGARFAIPMMKSRGVTVCSVSSQEMPDGNFPTVAFPNPEEKGAMDLLLALASQEQADIAFANDPDADRLAMAVPMLGKDRSQISNWVTLTGNQIGCLLAHGLLSDAKLPWPKENALLINTMVSSPLYKSIAVHHGAQYKNTLTGFKWIANAMLKAKSQGLHPLLGYEEALGYCPFDDVHDKDGVSTLMLYVAYAQFLKAQGRSLAQELDEMKARYGQVMSTQRSIVRDGPQGLDEIKHAMQHVRTLISGPNLSWSMCGLSLLYVEDYLEKKRTTSDHQVIPMDSPTSNLLCFVFQGGHRLLMRPSGTEPKLKLYVDLFVSELSHPQHADELAKQLESEAQLLLEI